MVAATGSAAKTPVTPSQVNQSGSQQNSQPQKRPIWPIFDIPSAKKRPPAEKEPEQQSQDNREEEIVERCQVVTPTKGPAKIPLIKTPTFRTPTVSKRTNPQEQETWKASPKINQHHYNASPAAPVNGSGKSGDSEIQHPHTSYKFLYPPNRRDINKLAPDHPDYDERTLYVPDSFLDSQTPALRQWWLIKQRNMDCILFFKMGKFYELFNEDAVIAVNELDILYMKGDETKPAHAGFPEISYEKYSKTLINRGYKVIRIEQTETPAMMEERCNETGRRGKFDKVVKREVCRITSKGTQMLGVSESIFYTAKNQYLLAICGEENLNEFRFGVCFVDVTIGKIYLGQFTDDHNLSKLHILLAHHTPTEVLYERGNLNQQAYQALVKSGALLTILKPVKEFWHIKKALSHLKLQRVFQDESDQIDWPNFIKSLFEDGDSSESLLTLEPKPEYRLALGSFGALIYYLQSQMILKQVLSCSTYELYVTPLDKPSQGSTQSVSSASLFTPSATMIMDHIALKNLEVFEGISGSSGSTLFKSINYCKTHFGQRLLRNWLCSPLCDIRQINNRLDAVEALVSNDNITLMNEFTHVLGSTPDLERILSKIKSQCFKSDADSRAIMFDGQQYSKAKIASFLQLISNFKRLQKFITTISELVENCESSILKRLLSFTTEGGLYPDYSATLDYFESAFDHEVAKKTGQIIPSPGVDKNYDRCQEEIQEVKDKLGDYLDEQKKVLNCRSLEYFGSAKNRYQIQVPEAYCKRVPSDYRIETTRKGFKRYYTPTIDKLFKKLTVHEEEMKRILDSIMSTIFEQFSKKFNLWTAAIECMAILDVLQSIAHFVRSLKADNIDVCRPKLMECSDKPILAYENGRHAALVKTNPNFTPNNLTLDHKLILLSGANMGGKSTLMRQSALLVILAQIGCFVPASKMHLTPVDRIFSRLGASDRMLEGESTFYTELVETSAMIRYATSNSLLLLDELGRGTSTYDGTAIAYAVLKEISGNLKCRCLFSTHYHTLVRDFQFSKEIRLAHMACKVEKDKDKDNDFDSDPLKENITFMYKIADGPVGRSYGFNVAKLAKIDDSIISEASKKAKELELCCKVLDILQELPGGENSAGNRKELKRKVLASMVQTSS